MITSKDKIYEQVDKASERINDEETYFSMTYEEGVKAALEWVLGEGDLPFDD